MRRMLALVGVIAMMAVAVFAGAVAAHEPTPTGTQGCTPGFWKNNLNAWETSGTNAYDPNTLVFNLFAGTGNSPELATMTMLQALQYGGNNMEAKLYRAAVAALLNTVHYDVAYPFGTEAQVQAFVNAAILIGTQDALEAAKNQLDAWNNLGCPLSANRQY
jgi:hypothetical protein